MFTERMFSNLDKIKSICAVSGYGIIGNLNTELKVSTAQAGACMQITPGKFVTPTGDIGSLSDTTTGVFPHSFDNGASGVILAVYGTTTSTTTDDFGRSVVLSVAAETSCACISMDDYGDGIAEWFPRSVVLAVYTITDGAIELDETSTIVPNTRKPAGATDLIHGSKGYSAYSHERNPHGTQLDDVYAGDVSLLKQTATGGYILGTESASQGTPGLLAETEIQASAWRIDYLGDVTGTPGIYYALLPQTPTAFSSAVDFKYMDVPADVTWIEKQNIVTTPTPSHVVVRYSALKDFDISSPVLSSSLILNTNSTKLAVSEGKLIHAQASGRISAGLDNYQDLVLHEVAAFINKSGSIKLCPSVVESAVVSTSLSGTSLTGKVTFPAPSQVTLAVRGSNLASAQEPPLGAMKITSKRFIGNSNFTFTVSNDEERTQLTVSYGETVVLTSSDPLHPSGHLQMGLTPIAESNWSRVDDHTVALLPVAHDVLASYFWVLPAGESPRWGGRSINGVGTNVAPKMMKAAAWLKMTSVPAEGDKVTVTTSEDEFTFTYGGNWATGTTIKECCSHLVSAVLKSDLVSSVMPGVIVDGADVFVRLLVRTVTSSANNWTVEASSSAIETKSFYGGGAYTPTINDLIGLGISVLYQRSPYVKRPKINVYGTRSLVDDFAATDAGKFHKLFTVDAPATTRWTSKVLSRRDLVMEDYDDRDSYDTTSMFKLGLTVVGYDAEGGQLTESITLDDVDAWSPKHGYSDLAFRSTSNVFSSVTSWVVSSTPPSVSDVKLYVLSNMYDTPKDMVPVRSFKLVGGKPRHLIDTRRIRMGVGIANEPSSHEKLHQALTMGPTVLSVGGLL
jgi:hypothetical protein